jgi:uncharacterized membrane protein YedE/YeeE
VDDFTPVSAVVGGLLIASSLALMLIATGRIAGMSGLFAGFLRATPGDWSWRAWFLVGMFGVGAVFRIAEPATYDHAARVPMWLVAISGVLVGIGTRASNGCTSGHGLCGISRFSRRSIIATITFFAVGVATATFVGTLLRSA